MKFDFLIGNPPYQDQSVGDNATYMAPVYNKFMDAAYEVAENVELIHPARFLFNAGSTPKAWNKKMLSDENFKVIHYEQDSKKMFANTEIKGGIAITYRSKNKKFGAIGVFTPYKELNSIVNKVWNNEIDSFSKILYAPEIYKFTEKMHSDFPSARSRLSKGHDYDLKSNVFDKLNDIFLEYKPDDGKEYIQILGRQNNQRVYRYIQSDYIVPTENLFKYKVFIAEANGSGGLGETLSEPILGEIGVGNTQTFISIGALDSVQEAEAIIKYIKTKFCRLLLSVLKVTQHNTSAAWSKVPMQNFTSNSDINWNLPVNKIDIQLYEKYNLNQEEIEFVETNVKEMDKNAEAKY